MSISIKNPFGITTTKVWSIELQYVNAQPSHKLKIIKRTPRRRIMQLVLAFAQERKKVSHELHEILTPKLWLDPSYSTS
jgi:hypothetical protein